MNFSTRPKAEQQGRGELFAVLKFAVIADLIPADIGDHVKPAIGVDHMGWSSQAVTALLDYVTRGDLGLRFIQVEAHHSNRLGPILNADESVACQLQTVEASHSDTVGVLQVVDVGALRL